MVVSSAIVVSSAVVVSSAIVVSSAVVVSSAIVVSSAVVVFSAVVVSSEVVVIGYCGSQLKNVCNAIAIGRFLNYKTQLLLYFMLLFSLFLHYSCLSLKYTDVRKILNSRMLVGDW